MRWPWQKRNEPDWEAILNSMGNNEFDRSMQRSYKRGERLIWLQLAVIGMFALVGAHEVATRGFIWWSWILRIGTMGINVFAIQITIKDFRYIWRAFAPKYVIVRAEHDLQEVQEWLRESLPRYSYWQYHEGRNFSFQRRRHAVMFKMVWG